jgi:hypothetical protein
MAPARSIPIDARANGAGLPKTSNKELMAPRTYSPAERTKPLGYAHRGYFHHRHRGRHNRGLRILVHKAVTYSPSHRSNTGRLGWPKNCLFKIASLNAFSSPITPGRVQAGGFFAEQCGDPLDCTLAA